MTLSGFTGTHPRLNGGAMELDYHEFIARLQRYEAEIVPAFTHFQKLKHDLAETRRRELRLDQFKAGVLSSFVRNRLLDQVYLPLIGANLAKQLGAAGSDTRTDRMGLLLLISPPGYGKTTLMEYVASRLGITLVKINGPALGHHVTSLDPAEARNASAREEIEKLNLAFEMGDNVMIYIDDIQHTNPEFLQKFISLCDGTRKIEGVFKGEAKTYDLRGRKVAVVMAGNPYTEVGGKFQVPDMLANRADTYNLGDILGGHEEAFKDSYIENALTSNAVLARIAARSHADALAVLKIARTGTREGVEFEGSFSAEEINDAVAVMEKLLHVREIILRVNQEYVRSAAMEDAYRTEPPFKLQGSYRNMNKIADKIQPLMTDAEVATLIADHYRGEAQTLSQAAEANL
ncbi:MAG: AAA family ATPase, partial [Verrucomicrobiales bacterium VVV1]